MKDKEGIQCLPSLFFRMGDSTIARITEFIMLP